MNEENYKSLVAFLRDFDDMDYDAALETAERLLRQIDGDSDDS